MSADYGQLELRILAHFSQDPVLIPLLRQNDDVFKIMAAEWNNIAKEMVRNFEKKNAFLFHLRAISGKDILFTSEDRVAL